MIRVTKLVAVIAVGLLIPSVMYGKTSAADTAEIKRILEKGFQLPNSTDPRVSDVDAKVKELREKLAKQGVLDEKEQKWLDKVQAARIALDKAKAAESLPTLAAVAIDQERDRKNKELEALFPQLQPVSSGINTADLTSKEKSCPADFSQYKAMGELLASDGVKQMQQQGGKFLEDAKKDKIKSVANLAKLADLEKKKIIEKAKKEKEGFAAQQEQRNFKESLDQKQKNQEERISDLKEQETALLDEKVKRQLSMVDFLFKQLIPKLIEDADDINKVRGIGNMVATRMQQERQHAFNAAFAKSNELATICQENVEAMQQGSSDVGTGEPLLATAFNVAYARNDEFFFTNFQNRAIRAVSNLQCRNAGPELEASLGESSTMKQRIDLLPQATDAGTLLQNVMNFLPEVSTGLANNNSPLKKSITDCEESVKTKKAIEAFIAREQQAAARSSRVAGGAPQSRRKSPASNQFATGKQHFGNQAQ